MPLPDMTSRLHRYIALAIFCLSTYFILSTTSIPSLAGFSRSTTPDICSTANNQWRGANDKIYPRSGAPVHIIHKDYSDGLLNHQVSVLFARSPSEDFSIQTDIFTSHPLPADNFDITYSHDELIINSLVPKNSELVTDETSAGTKHCVMIKVYISVPVSKPLTGLKLEFPQANVLVHESTAGALPYLDIVLGRGSVVLSAGQRLHTEQIRIQIDEGSIEGKIMLTKSLTMFLQEGVIDVDIGFSPFLVGATIDVTQQNGRQRLTIEDLFYRSLIGTYQLLGHGSIELHYPKSYAGKLDLLANQGTAKLHGHGLEVVHESGKGVLPAVIEAKQGNGGARTNVFATDGDISVEVADPGKPKRLLTIDE